MLVVLTTLAGFFLVRGIDDIQVGDCLTFEQIQGVLELERSDIYQGGECDIDYGLNGDEEQQLACGINIKVGEWHRQMVKHKKPGFFWFGRVPCVASVEFASYERTTYDEVSSELVCEKSNAPVLKYQQEKLATKKFVVGQGEAYLPNPMWVHREIFGHSDQGKSVRLSCTEGELVSSYVGFGKFEARWSEKNCDAEHVSVCREAVLSASENDKGQACGLVEKLTSCAKDER